MFILIVLSQLMFTGVCIYSASKLPTLDLRVALAVYWAWSLFLFVLLRELLLIGFARELTIRRGEKWTKELDYIYLALGGTGIAISISRLSNVTNHLEFPETLGPLIIATGLVIRAIKTKVEINGWNSLLTRLPPYWP